MLQNNSKEILVAKIETYVKVFQLWHFKHYGTFLSGFSKFKWSRKNLLSVVQTWKKVHPDCIVCFVFVTHSIKWHKACRHLINNHVIVIWLPCCVGAEGGSSSLTREKPVCWWKHHREQRPGPDRHTVISQSPLHEWDCPQPNLSAVGEEERAGAGRQRKIIKVLKDWEYVFLINSYCISVCRCI